MNSVEVSVFSQPKTKVSVSGLVLALKCAKFRKCAIRILFARSAPSHPLLLLLSYTKWWIFIQKNVRRVVLLKINGKNSTKRTKMRYL